MISHMIKHNEYYLQSIQFVDAGIGALAISSCGGFHVVFQKHEFQIELENQQM